MRRLDLCSSRTSYRSLFLICNILARQIRCNRRPVGPTPEKRGFSGTGILMSALPYRQCLHGVRTRLLRGNPYGLCGVLNKHERNQSRLLFQADALDVNSRAEGPSWRTFHVALGRARHSENATFAILNFVVQIPSCQLSPKSDAGTLEMICHRPSAFAPSTRAFRQNIAQR